MMFAPRYTVFHCGYLKGEQEMSDTPRTDARCKEILGDALGLEYAADELQYWAEDLERENAAMREQLEDCKAALRELDLTGIQYQEKPVDAVGRMRGIAMAALKKLP